MPTRLAGAVATGKHDGVAVAGDGGGPQWQPAVTACGQRQLVDLGNQLHADVLVGNGGRRSSTDPLDRPRRPQPRLGLALGRDHHGFRSRPDRSADRAGPPPLAPRTATGSSSRRKAGSQRGTDRRSSSRPVTIRERPHQLQTSRQPQTAAIAARTSSPAFLATWTGPSGRDDRDPKHAHGGREPSSRRRTITTVNTTSTAMATYADHGSRTATTLSCADHQLDPRNDDRHRP